MKQDILLCQITSQQVPRDEFSIELKNKEAIRGSLVIDSYIRANMIFTASKKLITRKVCKVSDSKYNQVTDTISKIIKI